MLVVPSSTFIESAVFNAPYFKSFLVAILIPSAFFHSRFLFRIPQSVCFAIVSKVMLFWFGTALLYILFSIVGGYIIFVSLTKLPLNLPPVWKNSILVGVIELTFCAKTTLNMSFVPFSTLAPSGGWFLSNGILLKGKWGGNVFCISSDTCCNDLYEWYIRFLHECEARV